MVCNWGIGCVCTFYTNAFENQVSSSSPSLVNLIRVWPASFRCCPGLDIGSCWCPDLRIRPAGPHFVRERSVVENRLQKTPQKMSRKKRPMQKMSQIPESLTAGWEEVSSCIQLTAPALKAGIGVECRVLWGSSSVH